MRAWVGLFVAALAVGVLQATVLARLGGFLPLNLLLVMAVLVGLQRDLVSGAAMVFGLGYLQDLFSASIPGLHMTAWLLIFFLAQVARVRLSPDSPFTQFLLGLLLCALEQTLVVLLSRVFAEPVTFVSRQLGLIGVAALVMAALTPLFYPLFNRLLNPDYRRR